MIYHNHSTTVELSEAYRSNVFDLANAIPPAPEWQRKASCAGIDFEEFYPERGGTSRPIIAEFCAGCPVRAECLEWAIEHEESGVWGGTTEAQRRKMQRSRAMPAHGDAKKISRRVSTSSTDRGCRLVADGRV